MRKLKEIVVKAPSESLSPEIINKIRNLVVEFIADELKFAANGYLKKTSNIVDYYFQPDVQDVFTSFITDQMIFNNYEVFKNGKEILVSHNNRNMINEEDIRDYIESNPELQSYLRQLLYTFYQENVDVDCLTKAALQQAYKDQRWFKEEEDTYDLSDASLTVQYAMKNHTCNHYDFPDVIEDNDFNGFLTQEFNKADVIKEVQIQPNRLFPMVSVEIEDDGEKRYDLNYENVIKNLKNLKHIIAKYLGVPINPEFDNFLAYYVNQLQEMEHIGEEEVYAYMTLQEFLDDLKSVHKYSLPEEWIFDPNYDIYSVKDLQEIKITPPVYIKMTAPGYGDIYVDGKPIGFETHDDKHYSLDEYDEDIYIRYGISFNDSDEEEYYPVEESEKLVQILLPKLKHLGAEIADNGYGVSIIEIPIKNVASITQADYPVYLGNGEFKYKDKTITYKQASPGSKEYQVYNSNGDLIKTINSPNTDFDSFMSFLTGTGQDNYNRDISPYGILTNLTEIKVRPGYDFSNTQPLKGEAKIETDYFREGYLMYLVDLGSYYTFMPHGDQQFVILIPKQYVEILGPPNDLWATEEHVKAGMYNIKKSISQGKIEIAKPMQTESVKPFKNLLLESYQKKVKQLIGTHLNENETAYHGSSNYFTSFKKEGIGGGTGIQAYGWGLYFGKHPNTAKMYTSAGSNAAKTKTLFQGQTAEELGFKYENEIFFGLPSGLTTAQEYINYAQEMISILEDEPDFESKEEILTSYRQFIDIIKDLEIEQEPMQYLYKVTLFPNKTPDYLDWDIAVPQSQLDKINQQIQKDGLTLQIQPSTGNAIYRQLTSYFNKDKEASMFLLKAGIDGVTHSKGEVRIVFDDRQIQIDKIYKAKEINDVNEYRKSSLNEYSAGVIKQMTDKFQKEMQNTLSNEDIKLKIDAFKKIAKPEALLKKIQAGVKNEPGGIVVPKKFTEPDPKTNKKPLDPLNILNYTWKDLEAVLDAYGGKAEKTTKDFYTVQDAELVDIKGVPIIYSGNGIKIYEGSNYESCIKLNYAFKYKGEDNKIYTYGFCIGRKEEASNQYYSYRFGRGGAFRSFYFVADSTQTADIQGNPADRDNFLNWYHFFVITAFDNGNFGVTDTVNQYGSNHEEMGNNRGVTWDKIGAFMIKNGGESGKQAWDKIKNLKDLFKYIPPPSEESDLALVKDNILNFEAFKNLTRNQKRIYVARRADQKNAFTSEMFRILDPELKNLALRTNDGYVPTYNDVKNSPSLGRSYAKFRFSRAIDQIKNGGYAKVIVPLPFIQYLTDEEKQQYLETFNGNLTFEYIDKYFGETAARNYVETRAKELKFLPPDAIKYIQDPNLKKLYGLIFKLSTPWKYSSETNVSDEKLESLTSMPIQEVIPAPLTKEQWASLSQAERKTALDITEKFSGNSEYQELLYALPIVVKNGNKRYVVLPENNTDDFWAGGEWTMVDEQGNTVKSNIPGDSALGDLTLMSWYPSEFNEYKRVYDIKDLKVA